MNSGAPRKKWDEMIVAQGADLAAFYQKLALDHTAPVVVELKAEKAGFVSRCDARIIGEVIRDLGGGRFTKDSVINHDVGVDQIAKPGDAVKQGGMLARIHATTDIFAQAAAICAKSVFEISSRKPKLSPLIVDTFLPGR